MKWFKFYGQDYLSDPKIFSLSGSERSCWITLLSFGSINDNGMITFLDEQQLMAQAGISPMHEEWDDTIGVLKKFEKLQMITLDNGMITIKNWGKRQETNLTGYERVKKYRENKKNDNTKKQNDNTKITSDKNRIDKIRIEENKREEKIIEEKIISEPQAVSHTNELLKIFYEFNPATNFANKSQRKSIDWLVDKMGLDQAVKIIRYALKIQGEKYAPVITTPIQLQNKFGELMVFAKKENNNKINICKIS